MSAIGNLNDYVKFQLAESMTKGGSAGGAADPAQMAMGFGLAQEMVRSMQQPPPLPGATPAAPAAAAPSGIPELLSPAQAAEVLGVTEADVIASVDAGDLKGKKIGSAYRISRAALESFLAE
jgi:excisionase family DNA binding protein